MTPMKSVPRTENFKPCKYQYNNDMFPRPYLDWSSERSTSGKVLQGPALVEEVATLVPMLPDVMCGFINDMTAANGHIFPTNWSEPLLLFSSTVARSSTFSYTSLCHWGETRDKYYVMSCAVT